MLLSDLNVEISYITYGNKNIRDSLINPALKVASCYKRSVGFFSTSVLDTILEGVIELARHQGHIQIIASPVLSESDVKAIQLGYQARESICKEAFIRQFENALDGLTDGKLQLTVQLIANGTLDIKITDLIDNTPGTANNPCYHDKLGIISDVYDNIIVFVGSPNETLNGYKKNYEKIRVFKSWNEAQNEYVKDEVDEFDKLWNGTNPYLKTYQFGDALLNQALRIKNARETQNKNQGPIQLRDYQREAIQCWVKNGYHGFYVMATGTGKTWTAIYSAIELQKKYPCMAVIAAPYKHLVQQWADDLKKAIPCATIVLVSSENHGWEQELTQAIIHQRIAKDENIVVISTIRSFSLERFHRILLKSKQEKLLIVDEAHRFTSRSEKIHTEFKYMLGLSATPFSGKSAANGVELMNYFGGQVYSLPIEKALEKGFLVGYYYYPIFIHATSLEENNFRKKTSQIAGCFRNGKCIDPDNLVRYIRDRLRIISMAQEKIENMDSILGQIKEKDHFIVYCGDGKLYSNGNDQIRHIQFVKRTLLEHKFKPSQFTASESMSERVQLVDSFNSGEIDALAAIRCLDEGINIPSIKGALILSSNDDYREFVQRRGRILRKFGNKMYANIYDVIVLPSFETPKMAEIEFRRYYEYARLAQNCDELLSQLDSLASEYGLELDEFVTTFEEIEERELDD